MNAIDQGPPRDEIFASEPPDAKTLLLRPFLSVFLSVPERKVLISLLFLQLETSQEVTHLKDLVRPFL